MLANRLIGLARTSVGTYVEEVTADSPAGWWRLDETTGTNAADSSGNGLTGTYGTGVTLDQAPLINSGRSILVTSAAVGDEGVDAPDIAASTALSGEIWIQRSGNPASNRVIWGKTISGATAAWVVWLDTTGKFRVELRYQNSTAGQVSISSPSSITDGNRHQIGFAWDKTGDQKVHIYVDGAQVAESAAWNQTIWAGSSHRTQIYQAGSDSIGFDEASIYLSYLDAARFAAHYNAGIA